MKSLLSLVLFSCLFLVCYSAVFLQRQRVVPGHEKMCHDEVDNVFYKNGEKMTWRSKSCGMKICRGYAGKDFTYAEIQTCGSIYSSPECHVEVNLSLDYPYCCGQLICSEIDNSNLNVTGNFHHPKFK